jgi:hypothetical protein
VVISCKLPPFGESMKKRRLPRPRKRKARPAQIGAKGKGEVADLSSTIRTGPVRSFHISNAPVERPKGETAEPKRIELADRVDTVPAMTNARAWKILPGLYLMAVSCKRGSPVRNVLDMTKWPRTGPDSGNRERGAAAHVKS